jgi:hypothetical protein
MKLHLLPGKKTKTKVQAEYERYRAQADFFFLKQGKKLHLFH